MRKTGRAEDSAPDSQTAPVMVNQALMVYATPSGGAAPPASAIQTEAAASLSSATTVPAESTVSSDSTSQLFEPATQARFRTVYAVLTMIARPLQRCMPRLLRLFRMVRHPWLLIPLTLGAVLLALCFPFRRLIPGLFSSRRRAMSTLTLAGVMGGAVIFSLPRTDPGRRAVNEDSEFQTLPALAGGEVVITDDRKNEAPVVGNHQFATPLLVRSPETPRGPQLSSSPPPAPLIMPGAWDHADSIPRVTVQTVQATSRQAAPSGSTSGSPRPVWLTGTIEIETTAAVEHSSGGPRLR